MKRYESKSNISKYSSTTSATESDLEAALDLSLQSQLSLSKQDQSSTRDETSGWDIHSPPSSLHNPSFDTITTAVNHASITSSSSTNLAMSTQPTSSSIKPQTSSFHTPTKPETASSLDCKPIERSQESLHPFNETNVTEINPWHYSPELWGTAMFKSAMNVHITDSGIESHSSEYRNNSSDNPSPDAASSITQYLSYLASYQQIWDAEIRQTTLHSLRKFIYSTHDTYPHARDTCNSSVQLETINKCTHESNLISTQLHTTHLWSIPRTPPSEFIPLFHNENIQSLFQTPLFFCDIDNDELVKDTQSRRDHSLFSLTPDPLYQHPSYLDELRLQYQMCRYFIKEVDRPAVFSSTKQSISTGSKTTSKIQSQPHVVYDRNILDGMCPCICNIFSKSIHQSSIIMY